MKANETVAGPNPSKGSTSRFRRGAAWIALPLGAALALLAACEQAGGTPAPTGSGEAAVVAIGSGGSRSFNEVDTRDRPRDPISYVAALLAKLDSGKEVDMDFLGRDDIGWFCRLIGFDPARNWAAMTRDQVAPVGARGPNEVPASEAAILLQALTKLIDMGAFIRKDGSPFDPTVLNDFLPAGTTFHGAPCLGNAWEFEYALAVELEHGRTFGANATNNHPILTAMIVLAHVLEDSLYYARLWVVEVEGELFKLQHSGAPPDRIAPVEEELKRAREYLQFRIGQK